MQFPFVVLRTTLYGVFDLYALPPRINDGPFSLFPPDLPGYTIM
jgi:hypothetical protein